jgi:hypothetical protein
MKRILLAGAALALMAGVTLAGGGGKIKWEDGRKHDALLAEAKATGKPVVLYFTGEG